MYVCLLDLELPEDDLEKIKTRRSIIELYVKPRF